MRNDHWRINGRLKVFWGRVLWALFYENFVALVHICINSFFFWKIVCWMKIQFCVSHSLNWRPIKNWYRRRQHSFSLIRFHNIITWLHSIYNIILCIFKVTSVASLIRIHSHIDCIHFTVATDFCCFAKAHSNQVFMTTPKRRKKKKISPLKRISR